MMWPGYGMGLGLGWLWVVLVLVGFALLIYVAIRVGTRSPDATGAPPTPAVDEFTERMRALSDG